MNFYSKLIINDIIDNKPLENIIENIEEFIENSYNKITKYSNDSISHKYIYTILSNTNNNIVYYCMDNEFAIDNCPSIAIYSKCKSCHAYEIRYYILALVTRRKFRGQGYASKLLDNFIIRIKDENKNNNEITIKIILSSLEESVLFYESYGFKWTREELVDHNVLMNYEKYDNNKEYFIMELIL
jgi:ribosomal protein S18 acetylase RimI-like enzyme